MSARAAGPGSFLLFCALQMSPCLWHLHPCCCPCTPAAERIGVGQTMGLSASSLLQPLHPCAMPSHAFHTACTSLTHLPHRLHAHTLLAVQVGAEELGLSGGAWARLADRRQPYGQPFPLPRGGVLQEVDWACGQVSSHACMAQWHGHVGR